MYISDFISHVKSDNYNSYRGTNNRVYIAVVHSCRSGTYLTLEKWEGHQLSNRWRVILCECYTNPIDVYHYLQVLMPKLDFLNPHSLDFYL